MTFTVTYRGADGAMRDERVEAANRTECFAQCRARGIAPLSVKEGNFASRRGRGERRDDGGKNGRVERAERVGGTGRLVAYVLSVALVALAIVGGAWWWMRSPRTATLPEPEAPKKAALPKEVKPAAAPKPSSLQRNAMPEPRKSKRIPKPDFFSKPQNEWTSREKALAMQYWIQDTNNVIQGIDWRTRTPPPAYSNAVQELMAAYTDPGADCVPFGPISDAEARQIIDTKITYGIDDSEQLLEQKLAVSEMIKELKEFMDNGGHAQTYFSRLEERQSLERDTMHTIRDEVWKLRKAGDYEGAKAALDAYNEYLKSKGLPTIRMKTGPGRKRSEDNKQGEN